MDTAQSLISDALQEILVQTSEQPLQTVDFQIARRYLNRMMNGTPFVGLGFTNVTLPTDLITIPDAASEGVLFNLAKRLLTVYDMPLTASLDESARAGLKNIRRITVRILPTSMPCTMPMGSGNDYDNSNNITNFYPCQDDEILNETGGSILQESNTSV